MKYRPEIDGLRSLAVLPVIFFHAGFSSFSGGFVGVDVFFVISGYLITTILLSEMEQKRFSIVNFYERRARRILPALFFVMFLSTLAAYFLLSPAHLVDFSQSLVAISLFSSNILFWQETGYWGVENELKPLLHTWSLAVEEQYYVLFPLFLMLMWSFRKRWVFSALVVVTIISLLTSKYLLLIDPSANFFLLPTRAWELAIGSFIAFYFLYRTETMSKLLSHGYLCNFMSLLGIGMIFFSILFFNEKTPFPSWFALVPTVGTALVITFSNGDTLISKFLSSRYLVGIGLISYSAYLWHQPLFAFARHAMLDYPSKWVFFALSALSLFLAAATWKYIEAPFRNKNVFSRAHIFLLTFVVSITFIFVGFYGYSKGGIPERYPPELRMIANLKLVEVNRARDNLKDALCKVKSANTICGELSSEKKNIIVIGDSHGPDGLNIMNSVMPSANFLIAQQGGCPLLNNLRGVTYAFKTCEEYNVNRFKSLESILPRVDVIVLSQRLSTARLASTKNTVRWLSQFNKKLVVMGAGPFFKKDVSELILKIKDTQDINQKISPFAINSHYGVDDDLEALTKELSGYYIRKQDFFCPENMCNILLGDNELIMFDRHHLTLSAAERFGDYVKQEYFDESF